MPHATLTLEVLAAASQMAVDRRPQLQPVVGVNKIQPPLRPRIVDRLLETENRVPATREVDPVVDQIPIPDAVVGRSGRQFVSLLGTGEVTQRTAMGNRVADRALESGCVQCLLGYVVGDAEGTGLEVDLVIVLPGEQDDRCPGTGPESLTDEIKAGVLTEPIVDQIRVVPAGANLCQTILIGRAPVEVENHPVLRGEQVARNQIIVLVVFDQQDATALTHRLRFQA